MSLFYKLSELPAQTCGIYKINYPNGKIYIGLSVDIKRRMAEHNSCSKTKLMPCDQAIKALGKITEIEILELCSKEELDDREKYWIAYYNSTNPDIGYNLTPGGDGSGREGEDNTKAVLTNDAVLDIRKRRFLGERKKDVYKDYNFISFSSFEHIWLGRGYPSVGKEYIIPTNSISRQEYSSKANQGLNNGRAKFTREQILDIRKMYDEGTPIVVIHGKYDFVSKSTITRIVHRQVYKDVE